MNCWSCGKPVALIDGRVGRRDECSACHADLHSCKNCHHYDAKAYNECRETSAEVVKEKDRSNFCDFFQPNDGKSKGKAQADLKAAAEALFKKKN